MPGLLLSATSASSGTQKKSLATSPARAARSFFCAMSSSVLRNASKVGSVMTVGSLIGSG
jgi:hypothetical protein